MTVKRKQNSFFTATFNATLVFDAQMADLGWSVTLKQRH